VWEFRKLEGYTQPPPYNEVGYHPQRITIWMTISRQAWNGLLKAASAQLHAT